MFNRLIRVAAPADRILDLETVRAHLRVTHTEDDGYIDGLIDVATAWIDGPAGIGVALGTQAWRMSLDALPKSFTIGLGPVRTIDSIVVAGETIDPATYQVDIDSTPARVSVDNPPLTTGNGIVKVTFTAGYGTDVPADIRHAALLIIGHLYENREASIAGGTTMMITEVPLGVSAILSRYRVHSI